MKNHSNLSVERLQMVSALACILLSGCAGSSSQVPDDPLRAKLEARETLALSQIAAPQQDIPQTPVAENPVPQPQPAPLEPQSDIAPSQGMTAAPRNLP